MGYESLPSFEVLRFLSGALQLLTMPRHVKADLNVRIQRYVEHAWMLGTKVWCLPWSFGAEPGPVLKNLSTPGLSETFGVGA